MFLLQPAFAQNADSLKTQFVIYYNQQKTGLEADTTLYNLSYKTGKAYLDENKIGGARKYNKIQHLYYLKIKSYSKDSVYLRRIKHNDIILKIYILERIENYKEALTLSFALLREMEKLDDHYRLADVLNEIGYIYYMYNNYEQSLNFYNRGHDETILTGDTLSIGASYLNLYGIYSALGDQKSAIAYCLSAAGCFKKINHTKGLRAAYANLAIYYQNINADQALSYALKSKELSGGEVDLDNPALEDIIIAEIYLKKAQSTNAEAQKNNFLEKSYEHYKIVQKIGTVYNKRTVLRTANFGFSEIEKVKGNYKDAYEYYIIYDRYNDTVMSGSNLSGSNSLLKYEFDKKEYDQKLLMQKKEEERGRDVEKQKIYKNFFILGFMLVAAGAIFIFKALQQKKRAMKIIMEQKHRSEEQSLIIEQKQQQLIDGMNYAQNIQRSLIKEEADLKGAISESVLYYKPKEIISGDFYWFHKLSNGTVILLLADCTGHGVPGALLSMIGISAINEIVQYHEVFDVGQIILSFSEYLKKSFKQNEDGTYTDGIEVSICSISPDKNVEFIGVNQSIYVLGKDGKLVRIEPQINSINGVFDIGPRDKINPVKIAHNEGSRYFLFSDGITDQFGGNNNKKFLSERLENCLKENAGENLENIKKQIVNAFESWRGRSKQTDDVTFIGFTL